VCPRGPNHEERSPSRQDAAKGRRDKGREKPAEDTTPPTDATPDDLREGRRREADERIPLERLTTTTSVFQVTFGHWTSTSFPLFILRSTDNSVKDGSSSAL
jgi:hypothetical protein